MKLIDILVEEGLSGWAWPKVATNAVQSSIDTEIYLLRDNDLIYRLRQKTRASDCQLKECDFSGGSTVTKEQYEDALGAQALAANAEGKTLLQILVAELPGNGGWPEGAVAAVQDSDLPDVVVERKIKFAGEGFSIRFDGENWVSAKGGDWHYGSEHDFGVKTLATDHTTSIITREQYEAALSAKNEGWIEWAGGKCPVEKGTLVDVKLRNGRTETRQTALEKGDFASYASWRCDGNGADIIAYRLSKELPMEVESTWNGEGLPPVGCECVVTPHNTVWGFSSVDDYTGRVLAYDGEDFWFVMLGGVKVTSRTDKVDFRPIKSEADKNRDAAIEAIDWYMPECILDTPNEFDHAKKIYDAIAAGKIPGVKLEV